MKNILLFAHSDSGEEARLQCALDITRAVVGHMTCVDVARDPLFFEDYVTTAGAMIVDLDEHQRESDNKTMLQARLEREDVPWEWIDEHGDIAKCLRHHAELADAIVVNSGEAIDHMPDLRSVASAIARGVRGVVVAVPESCRSFDVTGKAVIAWDGSPPSIAAMRGAIPLLALASSVDLIHVEFGAKCRPPEDAAKYLSHYDIHAQVKHVHDGFMAIDDHIRRVCKEDGAAYCLMGTYGHSKITDALFGGVARRMIGESTIPLIIGH